MEHKYTRKYWANGRWNYEYGDTKKSDTPANRPHSRPVNHVNGTAGPVAKGQKVVTTGPVGTAGRDERRPSKIPKPTPSDTVNSMRKDGGRRSVQESSKENAALRKAAAERKEVRRYDRNVIPHGTERTSRYWKAYTNSATAAKVLDSGPKAFRGSDPRAFKRFNDTIDAANASIKSKKSVKRKLRKAKYAVSNAANAAKKQLKERQKYVRDRISKMK